MSLKSPDYLNSSIRPILYPLLESVLRVKPDNPIPFMISWLKEYEKIPERVFVEIGKNEEKYKGNKENNIFVNSKSEIENFRDELLKFKEHENNKGK